MRFFLRLFLLAASLAVPASSLRATFAISLDDNIKTSFRLGHYLEILEDKSGKLNLWQVASPEVRGLFQQSNEKIPNFGFSNSIYWVRFTLYNPALYSKEFFLEYSQPLTDHVDFYYKNDLGKYMVKKAGDHLPFGQRDIDFHNFIFRVPVHAGINTYYLRIQSSSSVTIDMSLYDHNSLLKMMNREKIWLGFYYGIMMVMLVYNFFIFISLRDRNYFLYSIYIISFILFQYTLNGLAFQYLWPDWIWWANVSPAVLMGLISLTGLVFTRDFLHTSKNTRFWDNVLIALILPIAASIGFAFFSYQYGIRLGTTIGTILIFTMLIVGFVCVRKGDRAAIYYILAWGVFLVGSILKALQSNGIVATNFVTLWSQQIGSALDVTLLSLAMMDRFNRMKQENEDTQLEILSMQRLYSESLENTVEDRTRELTKERNKLESKNKIMEYELSLARSIQQKLIPHEIMPANIAAMYKPMILVGGDFFDIIPFENSKKTGIFISDVAGHGVQAAFITSMIKTILLQRKEKLDDPAALLSHINDFITGQGFQGFITIFYAIFDSQTRQLVYANAGHPAPFIITDEVGEISGYRTPPVGILDNEKLEEIGRPIKNAKKTIPANSKIVFYTDGLTECIPVLDSKKPFEQTRMKPIFLENRNNPGHVFINNIYNELVKYRQDDSFADDICIVTLDVE